MIADRQGNRSKPTIAVRTIKINRKDSPTDCYATRLYIQLRYTGLSVESYYTKYGFYPVTDADGTWFDKLLQEGYLDEFSYPTQATDDGLIPADESDNPLVYRIIQSGTGIESGQQTGFMLYAVGWNGVDDRGGLDDWEYHTGPNWGYWYKKDWTEAVVVGVVGSVLILIVFMGCVLWLSRRPGWKMLMITSIGILVFIMSAELPVLIVPNVKLLYYGSHFNAWQFSARLSPLFLFITIIAWFVSIWRMFHLRRLRLVHHQCVECGYDLEGVDHERCPECGHVVGSGCRLSYQD